jgi:hypothetical protein
MQCSAVEVGLLPRLRFAHRRRLQQDLLYSIALNMTGSPPPTVYLSSSNQPSEGFLESLLMQSTDQAKSLITPCFYVNEPVKLVSALRFRIGLISPLAFSL